mmetsp:Transcript_6116/g.15127  ORF Transcript_6116/g.15127 Transcript_6116/m.15127 type:complete len:206 (-) Transcript_6116:1294-1911(-)
MPVVPMRAHLRLHQPFLLCRKGRKMLRSGPDVGSSPCCCRRTMRKTRRRYGSQQRLSPSPCWYLRCRRMPRTPRLGAAQSVAEKPSTHCSNLRPPCGSSGGPPGTTSADSVAFACGICRASCFRSPAASAAARWTHRFFASAPSCRAGCCRCALPGGRRNRSHTLPDVPTCRLRGTQASRRPRQPCRFARPSSPARWTISPRRWS